MATSYQDRNSCQCWAGVCMMLTAIFTIFSIAFGVNMIPDLYAEESICNITNVTYPTSIPTIPSEVNENFVPCDCGRHCMSDIGYCVRVFVEHNFETVMVGEFSSVSPETPCTFKEEDCFNEEDISSRIQAIQEAGEVAAPFVSDMNNSIPLVCYSYNGNIFIVNHKDSKIILVSVVGSLSVFFLLLSIYSCRESSCLDE